jgi:hypothetical protein
MRMCSILIGRPLATIFFALVRVCLRARTNFGAHARPRRSADMGASLSSAGVFSAHNTIAFTPTNERLLNQLAAELVQLPQAHPSEAELVFASPITWTTAIKADTISAPPSWTGSEFARKLDFGFLTGLSSLSFPGLGSARTTPSLMAHHYWTGLTYGADCSLLYSPMSYFWPQNVVTVWNLAQIAALLSAAGPGKIGLLRKALESISIPLSSSICHSDIVYVSS